MATVPPLMSPTQPITPAPVLRSSAQPDLALVDVRVETVTESSASRKRSAGDVDAMELLRARGVELIDKRPAGGALWAIGGPELTPMMDEMQRLGMHFTYAPSGGRATRRQPAWYCKQERK